MTTEFMGQNGFVWFFGVVEDIMDPLRLGRCKVRCFGIHSDDKQQIPTEDLPWAHPMQPITSAAISGVGTSPTGVLPGTHVVGFFRDGVNCQQPIIMGSVGGIPQTSGDPQKGFSDPAGVMPRQSHIGISDTNFLAGVGPTQEGTIITTKMAGVSINHPTPDTNKIDDGWSEPPTPAAPIYPYNQVRETISGHIQELDDTPGKERIHQYHRSGTFHEIHPDGTEVNKIVSDRYVITAGKDYIHINGNSNIMIGPKVGGQNLHQGNSTVYIVGDADLQVGGNLKAVVKQNANIIAEQAVKIYGEKGVFIESNNSISFKDGEVFKFYTKDGNTIMKTSGDFKIQAEGNISLVGKGIDLN